MPDKTHANGDHSKGWRHPVWRRVGPLLVPEQLPEPINPALMKHAEDRAKNAQNRIADAITALLGLDARSCTSTSSGSACWIGFGVEKYPFGLLTMIVSLEAIFLSTFVMISQNRADAKRQVIADAAVEDGAGGGHAEPGAAGPLAPDPGADAGGALAGRRA